MPLSAVIDRAIGDVADGAPIDWDVLDSQAPDGDRELVKYLRLLYGIAELHRSTEDDRASTINPPSAPASGSSENATDDASESWGRFPLLERVGEGSFGSVFRAWDPELERHVALKILHRDVADARLRERLLREGRALAKVSHDNVVKVLGVEAQENRIALCMEFVRGETLANVVDSHGAMTARETVLIGKALCGALLAVHRAGFIHRDVKAKNVMREEETGRIVLMDFGTGRAADRPEVQGDLAGTPLYMAPEVLEGEPASACSDVYSLGVLLYYLVTGEYPVEANSVEELRDAHLHRRHRLLSERRPDLPIPFMQVVERSIASDPGERYLDAGEFLEGLRRLSIGSNRFLRVLRYALVATAIVGVVPAIGFLTSTHFNIMLERIDFTTETLRDSFVWGRMSSVPPLFVLILTLLVVAPLVVARRILVASSARARKLDKTVRQYLARTAHQLRLDEVLLLASCALVLSASAIAAAWWYFLPLLTALTTYISRGSTDDLALLSPAFVEYHNRYRVIFSCVVMLSVAVWIPVVRLVRKGQPLHRGVWVGAAVVTCVALVFLHFPYRLLYFNKAFETVSWGSAYCFIIAERGEDLLLTCPEIQPPRNRIVRKGDMTLSRLGVRDSVYSRFHRRAAEPSNAAGP